MRIATYNLWNDTSNWPQRLAAIAEELARVDADIVAMQEAPTQATDDQSLTDFLRDRTRYPHLLHLAYPEEPEEGIRPEGLAFASKLPFEKVRANWEGGEATANNWAVRVVVSWRGASLSVTNIHLDWEHAASREQHVARIVRELVDEDRCDYDILCGDFNDDVNSLVAHFLEGRASIAGWSTEWRDLAHAMHAVRGEMAPFTIDVTSNPRWRGNTVGGTSGRFDRIYLRSVSSGETPRVMNAGLFGKDPVSRYQIVPSDHYGVFVDLELHPEA